MNLDLGTFSVSLAVKDLQASWAFYQAFGFEQVGGDGEHFMIIRSGNSKLGLFQGMFDDNILTFNPEDVRGIQAHLQAQGIGFDQTASGDEGPAHAVLYDPDGNIILIDQL